MYEHWEVEGAYSTHCGDYRMKSSTLDDGHDKVNTLVQESIEIETSLVTMEANESGHSEQQKTGEDGEVVMD